jgi:16S rRNA (cytosine1402-N4)-methyltransferase
VWPSDFLAYPHLPVLYQEILDALQPQSPGRYVDGTIGAGGHAWGILEKSIPEGRLLGLDVDPQALSITADRLKSFEGRFTLVRDSYLTLADQIKKIGWHEVNGILLDLGVSSMQIDTPERGFSFMIDGPLDMRLDPGQPATAASLVNHLSEEELSKLIWEYGEDRFSRRIARAIILARPLQTTHQLAEVIRKATGSHHERIHPATRTFQALRIALNGELSNISSTLPQAINCLAQGGRLAIISFHSLEDRIVKHTFQHESKDCICPPEQPVCTCNHHASVRILTRHPIEAGEQELEVNPRARSARLRVIEKI